MDITNIFGSKSNDLIPYSIPVMVCIVLAKDKSRCTIPATKWPILISIAAKIGDIVISLSNEWSGTIKSISHSMKKDHPICYIELENVKTGG